MPLGQTSTDPGADLASAKTTPVLVADDLVQEFVVRGNGGLKGTVHAVSGVSFDVQKSETLGIVGESGSGKSTLARCLVNAPPAKSGRVIIGGKDLAKLSRRDVLRARQDVQMVFQDPFASLDPKWHVSNLVEEPLLSHRIGNRSSRKQKVREVLDLVGLDPIRYGALRPNQLSGGQCQRVAIARALVLSPSLVICDEAVSSLDVVIQAQVLHLFEELRKEFGLSYLFIAHDLALVKQVSDRVAVMYLGRFCEVGPADSLYRSPLHPYTRALLDSIPIPDPTVERVRTNPDVDDEIPSPMDPPSGCRFRTRCPHVTDRCAEEVPELRELAPGHSVACHHPLGGRAEARSHT